MDAQIAQWVLYGITAIAVIAWCAGVRFLSGALRVGKSAEGADVRTSDTEGASSRRVLLGRAEVEGRPAEMAARAASALARGTASPLGQMKVLERTDDRVGFEAGVPSAPGGPGQFLRYGEICFAALGTDRTAIEYMIELSSGKWLLRLGWAFQILGLTAIVCGFWAIQTYVVPHGDPAVRGQTLQMLQVGHFLWPPFLFGGLYRQMHRTARTAFDTLIHNLPYHKD